MYNLFIIIKDSLNQNIGAVTFIVGFLVIYLYLKERKDKKRDAASLILQEVRYAEQQIRNFREANSYQLYVRLLPTDSWNENIHLFVKDLEEHELDMISSFYARSKYIDYLIEKRSEQIIEKSIISITPPGAPVQTQIPDPQVLTTVSLLQEISRSIEFIHNTPVVEKLRNVATKKWYELF